MVVPTDIQFSFIAAAALADLGAKYIETEEKKSPEKSRLAYCKYRLRALIFPIIFLVPAAMISLLAWPSWETQYWSIHAEQVVGSATNATIFGVFLILLPLAALLGNWLGFRWVLSKKLWLLRLVYIGVLVVTAGIVAIQWPGPIRLGSYAQFHSDPTVLPFIWQDSAFFITFIVLLAFCIAPLVFFFILVRREVAQASPTKGR